MRKEYCRHFFLFFFNAKKKNKQESGSVRGESHTATFLHVDSPPCCMFIIGKWKNIAAFSSTSLTEKQCKRKSHKSPHFKMLAAPLEGISFVTIICKTRRSLQHQRRHSFKPFSLVIVRLSCSKNAKKRKKKTTKKRFTCERELLCMRALYPPHRHRSPPAGRGSPPPPLKP